jgi:hypothetical protein
MWKSEWNQDEWDNNEDLDDNEDDRVTVTPGGVYVEGTCATCSYSPQAIIRPQELALMRSRRHFRGVTMTTEGYQIVVGCPRCQKRLMNNGYSPEQAKIRTAVRIPLKQSSIMNWLALIERG